jgi:mannobiose 2-epimerase
MAGPASAPSSHVNAVLRTLVLLIGLLLPFAALPGTLQAQGCGAVQIGLFSDRSGSAVGEGEVIDIQLQIYSLSGMQLNGCSVSWRVTGPGTLLNDGPYGARVRVGPGPGTLTVSVRPRGSSRSASIRFAVVETPMLLELRPDTIMLAIGEEKRPELLLTTGAGDTHTLHSARWESDTPAVATVDSTGMVRAIAPGTATIRATIDLSGGERQRSVSAVVRVGAAQPAATLSPFDPEARRALAATLRRSLRQEVLAPLYPRALDREAGGFLSEFDYQWQPSGAQDKMIVTQARHVWTNARVADFFPEEKAASLANARHGVAFLEKAMWDEQDGGFYWLVTRDGTPKAEPDGQIIKQAYGEGFAIYALAAYYAVSGDTTALRLARDAFNWLDRHAHDPVHRGYFNYLQRDGTPLRTGYQGTPPKDQNSSIHLLEAFTELYRVWPDPVLRDRLDEMLTLIRDTIRVEPGTLTLFSTADWQPISYRDSSAAVQKARHYFDHVSFGHNVETAYLMLEAADALGIPNDSATLRAGKQMVDHALRTGWDPKLAGLYDEGYYFPDRPGLTITVDTKAWWSQAEALNTLLLMADLYPEDPLRYQEKFLAMWSYIDRYLIDHEHGGWYEAGLDTDPDARTARKTQIWKAAYHEARALMNVIQRLEQPTGASPVIQAAGPDQGRSVDTKIAPLAMSRPHRAPALAAS